MSTPISIGETDNQRSFEVTKGTLVTISLGENASTGYTWELAQLPPGGVNFVGDDYVIETNTQPGASGSRKFQFVAAGAGRSVIRLTYRRPWEPAEAEHQTFSVTITVR